MTRILIPIGDAAEVLDTFYPLFRLKEEGYEVVVAGPEKRGYHLVLHERPDGWDITQERPGYHIQAAVAFRDARSEDYAGMFISGGRAPEYLRYNQDLLRLTREIHAAGKPIAAVCHGIEILSAANVIAGRTVTTVAKCAMDAQQGGATYVDRPVVVDGNLVTARTWHDNTPFLKEFVALLKRASAR